MIKAKKLPFWIGLLVLAGALVCVFAFSKSPLEMEAGAQQTDPSRATQFSDNPNEIYEGIVTDSRCGAKHSANVGLSAADCTRACVHAGERFALVDGEQTYMLRGEPEHLKRMAGERVKISGMLNGNTIEVGSIAEADSKTE